MGLNHEKLKKTKDGARGGTGWKTAIGQNRVFILPPHSEYLDEAKQEELENLALQCKMHYFKIDGRPTEVSRCLEDLGQRCPACEAWRINRKSEDPGLKEMAKEVSPSDQYLFNMIDINNPQNGVQGWSANYTCWNGIMGIGCNAMWGDVNDPTNGVIFDITMTPGTQTKTGRNQYSVDPEPNRASVMNILETIENWEEVLDTLVAMQPEAKEPDEIRSLLEEIGFPMVNTTRGQRVIEGSAPPAPASVAPPPVATIVPTAIPAPVAAAAPPAATPVPTTAAPPVAVPATPAPPAAATVESVPTTEAREVHYDPGTEYIPKVLVGDRPVGVPRCYGDYKPLVHACRSCPVVTECQMAMLGIDE